MHLELVRRGSGFWRIGILLLLLFAAVAISAAALADSPPGAAGVLVLADSNGEGPFGGTLYDGLRKLRDPASGALLRVSIFAKCGAGASDWVDRERATIDCGAWRCGGDRPISACLHFKGGSIPALKELYSELGAERRVTVVALGLNMIIGKREAKLAEAAALIDAIRSQNSGCIWVGPPQAGDLFVDVAIYDSFLADLRNTVTRRGCRFVTSADKTDRRDLGAHSKDDHYARPEAIAWASKVLAEMSKPGALGELGLLDMLKQGQIPR